MKKVKGLGITKKQILDAARAKALSYVISPRKKTPLTAKEKKALAIYEVAKNVGGCQTDDLLKLLDVLTGLPVSKAKSKIVLQEGAKIVDPSTEWCENNPLRVLRGVVTGKHYLCLGRGVTYIRSDDDEGKFDGSYQYVSKEEVQAFFLGLRKKHIPLLMYGLIE